MGARLRGGGRHERTPLRSNIGLQVDRGLAQARKEGLRVSKGEDQHWVLSLGVV